MVFDGLRRLYQRPFFDSLFAKNAPPPPTAHPAALLWPVNAPAPAPTAQPANTFLSRLTLNRSKCFLRFKEV